MTDLVLCMSMSLDGFIAGPGDVAGNPFGDGGIRLHRWLETDRGEHHTSFRPDDPVSRTVYDELMGTGAVVIGKRFGDLVDYWGGDHHDGVPIFVLTHEAPPTEPYPNVHYVTDGVASCVAQAKGAACDRDVLMHGASSAQEALRAGVVDVLEIQLVPVLLGHGRRLFDGLGPDHLDLRAVRTLEASECLHLRYEVVYA
jgi:dihydrofolate reductase